MAPTQRLSERVTAVPRSVPSLRRALVAFASRAGASDAATQAVRLAVSEALTNVVVHAYADAPEPGTILAEAWTEPGTLVIVVRDEGHGMRPRTDSPGLGMGLAIIAQMADDVVVSDRPGHSGAELTMRFSLDGSGSS